MNKIKRVCLLHTLIMYVVSTLWTPAYAGKVSLTEKEVIPPNGRKVRIQERASYSLTEEIKDVLGAKPDVPLNVYQAIYQRGLMTELESGSIELKDAWGMIKSGLLFDVESLVERDDLEGFLSDPQASLKAEQGIQQSYFSKILSHLEHIEKLERALSHPQQVLSATLKEAKGWMIEKIIQLKGFYEGYLTTATQLTIQAVQQPSLKGDLLEFTSEKAIMTGDILMGSEERFYRVSRRVARTVVSVNERGEPIKKEQGSSVSNHAVSSLPKDNPRLYFKAFSSRVGLKPGHEFMMGSLYDLLHIPYPESGVLLFTNLTHNNNPPSIVMVSEGIPGRTGKQVLKERPQFFEALDQEAYEKQAIGAMLTDHGDGKADNFICLENPSRLIPIDNEEVFAPILSEDKKGLRIKSILFTLPQMETPLSSYQRSYLQSLTPQWLTYLWLREMERRNQAYHQLEQSLSFQMLKQQYQTVNMGAYRTSPQDILLSHYNSLQPTLRENHSLESHCYLFPETFSCERQEPSPLLGVLSLPLQMTAGRIQETTERLGRMQLTLRDHKSVSLQDLLQPLIGAYYQKLRDINRDTNTQKLNIKEALRFLYGLNDAHQQNEIETFLGRNTSLQGPDGGLTVAERVKRLQGLQEETGENPTVLQGSLRQSIQVNELLLKALTFLRKGYFPVHSYIRDLEQFREEGLRGLIEEESRLLRDLWNNGQRVLSHTQGDLFGEGESTCPSIHRVWKEAFQRLRPLSPSLDWLMTVEENFIPRDLVGDKEASFPIEGGWMGKRFLPSWIRGEILDQQGQLKKDPKLSGRSVVRGYPEEKPLFYFKAYPEFPGYEYGARSFMTRLGIQGLPYTDLVIFRPGEKAVNATGSSHQASSSNSSISAATSSSQPSQSPYPVLLTQAVKGYILKKHWGKPLANLDFEHTSRLIIASMLINPEDGKEDNFILSPDGRYLIPIDNDHVFLPGATRTVEGLFVKKVNTTLQGKTILYCLNEMKKPLLPETVEFIKSINVDLFLKGWLEDLATANEKYQNLVRKDDEKAEKSKKESLTSQFFKKGTVLRIPLDPEFMNNLYWKFHHLQDILTYQPDLPLIEILKRIEPYIGKRYGDILYSRTLNNLEGRFKEVTRNLYPTDARGNHISVLNSRAMMEIMHVPESEVTGRAHNIKQGPTAALAQLVTLRTETQRQEWQVYLEHGREPKAVDGSNPDQEQAYIDSLMRSKTPPEIIAIHHSQRLYSTGIFSNTDQLTPLLDHERGKRLKFIDLRNSSNIDAKVVQIISTLSPNLEVLNVNGCSRLEGVQGLKAGERLQFPTLRRLIIDRCPQLATLFIEAPHLQLIEASENPKLEYFSMKIPLLELQLMRGNITSEILQDIARFVPSLEILNVRGCSRLEGVQGSKAGERLQFPALRRLIIDRCPQLARIFIEAPHLQLIEASENPLLQKFSMKIPQLMSLQLGRNNIQVEGLKALSTILPHTKVTRLGESWQEKILSLYSPQRDKITELDFLNQDVGSEGAKVLIAILPYTQLKKLSLCNSKIGAEGVKEITAILPQTQITSLNLSSNNIGIDEIKALAAILPQTKITELYLWMNNIGTEGTKALAAVLPQTKINWLHLYHNNIGEEGVKFLAAVLPQTQITGLDLSGNKIGIEGKALLEALKEKMKINIYY